MTSKFAGVAALTPSHTGVANVDLKHSGVSTIAYSSGVLKLFPKFFGLVTVLPELLTMADVQLLLNSTNLVRLSKFKDVNTGAYPEDAVVTFTVYLMPALTPVTGATDIAMPKKVGTSGAATVYEGVVEETVALVAGTQYKVAVKAIKSGDQRIFNQVVKAVDG